MEPIFNRRDIGYTIISRFEEAFRGFISNKISSMYGNYQDGIPVGIIDRTKNRTLKKDWESPDDFLEDTEFPDLKEIVCFKNQFPIYFPGSTLRQEDFRTIMDELYFLRCKIAHIREYFSMLDLNNLFENTKNIADFLEEWGKDFLNIISSLQENPRDIIIPLPIEFIADDIDSINIPNNMPTPDYEYEGGFVGRDDDIKKLTSLLEGDLHRVVTISGAGGVGKTALALKIIRELVKKSNNIFDGIVWLSAKETKLSCVGIEIVEPTIKTYEQLLDTIIEVMGFGTNDDRTIEEKEKDVSTIFNLYNCILIVIDNLETITDEKIINFILDPHIKSKIFVTSRKGLGQVERRYELKQLKEKEAMYLFRQISREKNVISLSKIDDDTIKSYVRKVSCYPLAIKWVIGHVALGKDIHSIIDSINESTSDISLFCFDQIYKGLSNKAKILVGVLSCLDESPASGILKYVADLNKDDFEDAIQELILVSLVIPEQFKNEQDELSTRYSLLSLTRGFVRRKLDDDSLLKGNIDERLLHVQSITEEAQRAKQSYRFSLSYLGAVTDEEKVAAVIAQTAYQKAQAGRYYDAVEDFKRAANIAPRFASLYRNWAVIESQEGHNLEADKLMEKASLLNPKDVQIWLTWGTMKRKMDRIKEASDCYKKAYELSPDDCVVLNSYGQAESRFGHYSEADYLFKQAMQKEASKSSLRHEIINQSSLAENLHRWAQSLIADRNDEEAEKKLIESIKHCKKLLELDKNDEKSLHLFRKVSNELGHFYKRNLKFKEAMGFYKNAIVDNPQRAREIKDTAIASHSLAKMLSREGKVNEAKQVFSAKLVRKCGLVLRSDSKLKEKFNNLWNELYEKNNCIKGKIIRINYEKGIVVIESMSSPDIIYLGRFDNFIPKISDAHLEILNKIVTFIPKETQTRQGTKLVASFIKLFE